MPAVHRPHEPNAEAEIRELFSETAARKRAWLAAYRTGIGHEDGWKIVHEHASVPFDAETGKAVVTSDLSP